VARDDTVDISVVIGFKDWGTERLGLAVESLVESFGDLRGEVIVSDYGSTTCPQVEDMIGELGGRYVYTPTDGTWSRSRALNAGFAESTGRVLVSTDADMLFSPRAMETVGHALLDDPDQALVLQCRNLPEGMGSDYVAEHGMTWAEFEARASLRPRWGMGGMMAVSRQAFLDVRGFDERMQIYGGEDLDFAQRIRRTGRRVHWLNHPDVRMYHMWHPSSREEANQTPAGRAAVELNRDIYLHDTSFVRNTTSWRHRPADAPPAATVVISTRNRASLLRESVNSALAQTVQDVEVIVVDDGSTDETQAVLDAIEDPRLRCIRTDGVGIPTCRNLAATESRAPWTVIHDDDDLMLPDRIERHLAALQAGDSGTYGGWVDFDDRDGTVVAVNRGRPFSLSALMFSPRVLAHGTLMVRTDLIRRLGYDNRFRTGSDYNLVMRMARMGVRLRHSGHVHIARRLHGGQVTSVSSSQQQAAGRWSSVAALTGVPPERQVKLRAEAAAATEHALCGDDVAVTASIMPFLPDTLVERDVHVLLPERPSAEVTARLTDVVDVEDRLDPQELAQTCAVLRSASWEDLAMLRRQQAVVNVLATRGPQNTSTGGDHSAPVDPLEHGYQVAKSVLDSRPGTSAAVMSSADLPGNPPGDSVICHWRIADHDIVLLALPDGRSVADEVLRSGGQVRFLDASRLAGRADETSMDATGRNGAPAGARNGSARNGSARNGSGRNGSGKNGGANRGGRNGAAKNRGAKNGGAKNGGPKNGGPKNGGAKNGGAKNRGAKNRGAENRGPGNAGAEKRARPSEVAPRRPPTRGATGTGTPATTRRPSRTAAPAGLRARAVLALRARARQVLLAALFLGTLVAALTGVLLGGPAGLLAALTAVWLGGMALASLLVTVRLVHAVGALERSQREGGKALSREVRSTAKRTTTMVGRDLRRHQRRATIRGIARTRVVQRKLADQVVTKVSDAQRREASRVTSEITGAMARHSSESERAHQARVRQFRQQLDRVASQVASNGQDLRSSIEALARQTVKEHDRGAAALRNHLKQSQALLSLHDLVSLRSGAPLLGGWAASPDVMLWLVDEMLAQRPKLVVECGSGASTVWLSLLVREFGLATRVVALEHDAGFARATREQLARHDLSDLAEVRDAPLRPLESGAEQTTPWYDVNAVDDLTDIGLLFVDGPPGSLGPGARFPAMTLLKERMADSCAIVLDDANRADETTTAHRWRELAPDFSYEELDVEKGAVLLRRTA
jgi:GT2 family glycosyltransferase